MWLIFIIVAIGVIYFISKNSSANSKPSETQVKQQIVWHNPTGAKEHFVMFSVVGEAISSFDPVSLTVSYSWESNKDDEVHMTFYGINNTSIYQDTEVGRYLNSLSGDGWSASCTFTFKASQGGAPYYFRTNEAVLDFVHKYAPHAELDMRLSSTDFTSIRFVKHGLTNIHAPENLSATTLRAMHG